MGIISKLSAPPKPPYYAETLKKFPRNNVANHLGISYPYLQFILNGQRTPGKKLEARILELVKQVEVEMACN